jgi:elongator complex protein 3
MIENQYLKISIFQQINGKWNMKRGIIFRGIIEKLIESEYLDYKKIDKIIKNECKRHNLKEMPTKVELLSVCKLDERRKLEQFMKKKPTRTVSGVSVITVVAKPASCPGTCIYCPKGSNAPQSYTGLEPAIQRGIRNDYDPFLQTKDRLNQYRLTGHPTDKIEIIILGGTFLALDKDYQEWFTKRILDVLNGKESESLEGAQRLNEATKHRCVGITIETRADYSFEEHIDQMLKLGTTRVEIGVQSVYPEVLRKVRRGHTVEDVVKATQLTKDSCLKTTFHCMPGLFVDFKKDLEQFKILFQDPRFRPDSLKIYPTLVIKGTKLYDMWKKKEYQPLTNEEGVKILSEAMRYIPKYCRVIRVQRDIPSNKIVAGIKKSNLRELVEKECERKGIKIQEIRYREVGHKLERGILPDINSVKLYRLDYDASNGKEIFLSFEDIKNDILIGFLRLRIPYKPFRNEIDEKTGLVRELHVYGQTVPIGLIKKHAWQHKGFGNRLLKESERIAREEFDMRKMVVISGVGTRKYYEKFGYKKDGPFVSKII